jgi:hypothetical protein
LSALARVAAALPAIERGRLGEGPEPLVARLRERGRAARRRDEAERAGLRRAIALVDRFMPGGGNCYRRVLLEIALDAGAAAEPLHLGLQKGGGPNTGHAWLGDHKGNDVRYDVELTV